ncbi:hypothetical protein MLD38_033155 [Melastoma candidum]|uniref:Uncharacterized protein n=1 Tax=Melastoma candidum TaxID=119954 RepID=A0ACB9M5Z3_9MYRT|nr:hypothetical protein MLD38_033155 [Melastoma candidum]
MPDLLYQHYIRCRTYYDRRGRKRSKHTRGELEPYPDGQRSKPTFPGDLVIQRLPTRGELEVCPKEQLLRLDFFNVPTRVSDGDSGWLAAETEAATKEEEVVATEAEEEAGGFGRRQRPASGGDGGCDKGGGGGGGWVRNCESCDSCPDAPCFNRVDR